MKKNFFIILTALICVLISSFIVFKICINSIDTKYAIAFSRAMKSYDIDVIDDFFSEHTQLIYNDKQKSYNEIRRNIMVACQEKKYVFSKGSSYGYGNNKFINGIQDIGIRLYGKLNGESIGECNIKMKLRKTGLLSFEVESMESDEIIFGYIFYGERP